MNLQIYQIKSTGLLLVQVTQMLRFMQQMLT